MRRFFSIFIALQLVLFGIELTQPVQQHIVLPWTTLLARACVALVTLFDANAASMGKVLWNPSTWKTPCLGIGVGFCGGAGAECGARYQSVLPGAMECNGLLDRE